MKNIVITTILTTIFSTTTMAQKTNDETALREVITQFANAADLQDDKALEFLLDNNFRLGLNQLFGSKDLTLLNKQSYLQKIRSKEFGGDKRNVKIEQIIIIKNNASAQATFFGSKMTVVTLLQLIKTQDGYWKIVNDLPAIM
jgi:Putative lumazine-binding